jgi:DNA-damage-inducible protein D
LPENLPPAEHIKQVEKRIKRESPKVAIAGSEARGLGGEEPKAAPDEDKSH